MLIRVLYIFFRGKIAANCTHAIAKEEKRSSKLKLS